MARPNVVLPEPDFADETQGPRRRWMVSVTPSIARTRTEPDRGSPTLEAKGGEATAQGEGLGDFVGGNNPQACGPTSAAAARQAAHPSAARATFAQFGRAFDAAHGDCAADIVQASAARAHAGCANGQRGCKSTTGNWLAQIG